MVIWLIGMSASGKTTIGKKLFNKLQSSNEKWIFLDGDTFRNVLGEDLGHTLEDRRKNAYRISRFCEYLNSQGINVLACVLSIFHENQRYNKENIKDYKEVYIDVSFENLVKRDNKELYIKAQKGEIKDVVGVDIEFKPPFSPNMIIDNNIDNPDYESMIEDIIKTFKIDIDTQYSYTHSDLLKFPHKYQYSKFEGNLFFNKFQEDRKLAVSFFEHRIKRIGLTNSTIKNRDYINKDNLILKEFLAYLLSNEMELKNKKNIIDLLIKRFEVGKKLYLTYDLREIRKSSVEFNELLNYPLFSMVLQKYYKNSKTEEKYVYLNAILKVNDIISSIKSDFILIDEIKYAKKALEGELKIVEEMIC
jgi:cytidine diphosphoramidate kinase